MSTVTSPLVRVAVDYAIARDVSSPVGVCAKRVRRSPMHDTDAP